MKLMRCDLCSFQANSKEQYAGHRSAHVRRGELSKKEKSTSHTCKICGETFENGPALGGHRSIHNADFGSVKSSGSRKRRLIIERGHRCEKCKNTQWLEQAIPLHMDHVNGNSDDDSKTNLRLLCPNCHAQTETYGGRNVGRFPKAQRYQKMKKWKLYGGHGVAVSTLDCESGRGSSNLLGHPKM